MADANVRFTWNGPQIAGEVREAVNDGLHAAGVVLLESQKRTVGVNGGGIPSAPGEPPRKQRGNLSRSMTMIQDRVAGYVRVGTSYPVGRWLEFGTTRILPRPWLWVSYNRARARMTEVFRRTTKASVDRRLRK